VKRNSRKWTVSIIFIVVPCIVILSKSFYFTDRCTMYLFSSILKFTCKGAILVFILM
jgi:hypothetical protein